MDKRVNIQTKRRLPDQKLISRLLNDVFPSSPPLRNAFYFIINTSHGCSTLTEQNEARAESSLDTKHRPECNFEEAAVDVLNLQCTDTNRTGACS